MNPHASRNSTKADELGVFCRRFKLEKLEDDQCRFSCGSLTGWYLRSEKPHGASKLGYNFDLEPVRADGKNGKARGVLIHRAGLENEPKRYYEFEKEKSNIPPNKNILTPLDRNTRTIKRSGYELPEPSSEKDLEKYFDRFR